MGYAENIKKRREQLGMTQLELAEAAGYTSKSTISRIEAGKTDVSQSKLVLIARALQTTPSSLFEGDPDLDQAPLPASNALAVEKKRLPIVGDIACGKPIYADEDWEGWVEVNADLNADFCVRAKGDSMTGDRIYDGDIVFIHSQPIVENGQIAAVLIGDEATLKRVSYDREAGILQLFPSNPMHPIQKYTGEELNSIRILGKAVRCQFELNH